MPHRQVTDIAGTTNDISAAARPNAGIVAEQLKARFSALGVATSVDWGLVVTELADLADAASAAAVAADVQQDAGQLGGGMTRSSRRASLATLRGAIAAARNGVGDSYGRAALRIVFHQGATPRDAQKLVPFAQQVAASLASASFTPLASSLTVFDLQAAATKLGALANALKSDSGEAAHDKNVSKQDLADRQDAESVLHDVALGVKGVVVGLLEAAGEGARAEAMSEHHHLRKEPAVVPPTGTGTATG